MRVSRGPDTQNGCWRSGSRLTEIGCHIRVREFVWGLNLRVSIRRAVRSQQRHLFVFISFRTIRGSADTQARSIPRRAPRNPLAETVSRPHRDAHQMAGPSRAVAGLPAHRALEWVYVAHGQFGSAGHPAPAHLRIYPHAGPCALTTIYIYG